MEKYPKYAKYIVDAIINLSKTGKFELPEADESQSIWLKFDDLLEKKNDYFIFGSKKL